MCRSRPTYGVNPSRRQQVVQTDVYTRPQTRDALYLGRHRIIGRTWIHELGETGTCAAFAIAPSSSSQSMM